MRRIWQGRRPSPALLVSMIALFAALNGVAGALPGGNKVDSGDIKNNAVGSADIKDNAVGGADVREATLGRVPSATNAMNATNATNATNAVTAVSAGSAATAVNANAVGGNRVVHYSEISTIFHHGGDTGVATNSDASLNPGATFGVANDSNEDGIGQGRYISGDLRTVHFTYTEEGEVGGNDCVLTGFAIAN